ncbi:MAG: molybdopterin-dependent oxidoreductase [Planctomycetes bacterium]|nr:molybdopterin-dependent oxidoreductase [Planctomycetota bacterium]
MRHTFIPSTIFLLALTSLFLLLTGCGSNGESEELKALKDVQITEYQGKDLSSISAFRENSIKGPQQIDIENYTLKVTGLVVNPVEYTYDEIIDDYNHYEKVVTLDCVEGWSATILWEGMLVKELIEEPTPLDSANTIIFHAYDGYTTSFPIEYITGNDILMAYKMNGVNMPPERGYPFQLVAESKWGYKWIKWITEIELSDDIEYEGYWERRGYSNSGDLDAPFY